MTTQLASPLARDGLLALSLAGAAEVPQEVSYSYWPVSYFGGDPTVVSPTPLPLSGVRFSQILKGPGELQASLQLASPDVRSIGPWDLIYPRKTGIVVVRSVRNPLGAWVHSVAWHGIVWKNPVDPATGRMSITAQTVESAWAKRLITGPPRPAGWVPDPINDPGDVSWTQADQTTIASDLLSPPLWSQLGAGTKGFPGWITVDPPTKLTGVLRDMTYKRNQQTNLLEAHQDRSNVINGYEWYTDTALLSGVDAYSASTFRCKYVMGYPRLGRRVGFDDVPRFGYFVDGRGNAVGLGFVADGSNVPNVVWGSGSGYDDATVQALTTNKTEWDNGFLISEARYSNPDVEDQSTLQDYTNATLLQALASERYISKLTVRGDLVPYFGTYGLGDDALLTRDDWTLRDKIVNGRVDRTVEELTRIMGWTVTPSEGNQSETVDLVLAGGGTSG